MTAVILTIHSLLVIALVGVVLLQRSEGGALGMGGGGGGGMMSGRGAANVLTRTTTVLAALFFTTSLTLAFLSDRGVSAAEIEAQTLGTEVQEEGEEGVINDQDLIDLLGDDDEAAPEEASPSAGDPVDDLFAPSEEAPAGEATETPAAEAENADQGEENPQE